jgi:hypothetical protein
MSTEGFSPDKFARVKVSRRSRKSSKIAAAYLASESYSVGEPVFGFWNCPGCAGRLHLIPRSIFLFLT